MDLLMFGSNLNHLWRRRFGHSVRFFAEGDGSGGGAGGDLVIPEWHKEVPYLASNPEAGKAFAKYKSADEAFKGAHEAIKQLGAPYRMPKDPTKLTDAQRTEIMASVAKMKGVPDTPEGYGDFEIAEGVTVPIDAEAMAQFKVLAHKQGKSKAEAQELLNLQVGMTQRLNTLREQAIKEMTDENYKQFSTEMKGDANALQSMELIKRYLQSKCLGPDGKPDAKVWEAFAKRIMYQDRLIELPLLRALVEPAQTFVGTGGAPGGGGAGPAPTGALAYPEMDKK